MIECDINGNTFGMWDENDFAMDEIHSWWNEPTRWMRTNCLVGRINEGEFLRGMVRLRTSMPDGEFRNIVDNIQRLEEMACSAYIFHDDSCTASQKLREFALKVMQT